MAPRRRSVFGRIFSRKGRPGFYVRVRFRGREVVRYAGPDRKVASEFLSTLHVKTTREDLLGEKQVPQVTAAELQTAFEEFARSRHGPSTVAGDNSRLHRLIAFLGEKPLRDVEVRDLQEFVVRLRSEGYKPSTINRHLAVASLFFRFALDRGAVLGNPVKGLPRQREPVRPIPFLSNEDLEALLAREEDDAHRAVFRFLADSGLRRGEATRLAWQDADLRRGVVLVRESKTGHPREVPLTETAKAALLALRRLRPLHAKPADRIWLGRPDSLSKRFERLAREAGLALRLHDLRHSCASRLAQAGVPLPTIGAILGHRCWATTARYASHLPGGAAREAMRLLEAYKGHQAGYQASGGTTTG